MSREFNFIRFSSQLLRELVTTPEHTVDAISHMDWHSDRAAMIGDESGDGLTDPPGGIC